VYAHHRNPLLSQEIRCFRACRPVLASNRFSADVDQFWSTCRLTARLRGRRPRTGPDRSEQRPLTGRRCRSVVSARNAAEP